jgi:hypothetical protein
MTQMLIQKHKPSKTLERKLDACVRGFKTLGEAISDALKQGRAEGFEDKEIGKMIRDRFLKAGLERSTIAGYLPSSAKLKPRGKPGSNKGKGKSVSGKNPQSGVTIEQEQMPEIEIIDQTSTVQNPELEAQRKQMDEIANKPVPTVHIKGQSTEEFELDPAEVEYEEDQLEKYSRTTLEKIIKWQAGNLKRYEKRYWHFQEGYNEAITYKPKYNELLKENAALKKQIEGLERKMNEVSKK